MIMTYQEIKKNEEVCAFLQKGNENLGMLGYTDHSSLPLYAGRKKSGMYIGKVRIFPEDLIELARIAGFMHDIGNAINRKNHAEYGALLANEILKKTDMKLEDRVMVVSAIGHHDESTGGRSILSLLQLLSRIRQMSEEAGFVRRKKHPLINMTG